MPEQEGLQMLAALGQHAARRRPGPDQVAQRLVRGIRDPHGRQFTGTMQLGQHHGVPAIGLHPVAGADRDQRRRGDRARVPPRGEEAVEPVPTRPRLVAETQVATVLGQPVRELGEHCRAVLDHSDAAHLTGPTALRNCDGHGRLVHIQSDEGDIFHQARPHA